MERIHRMIELEKKVIELENEAAQLRAAIEWAEECLSEEAAPHRADELHARAFPPRMETVEVKRWLVEVNNSDGAFVESDPSLVPDFINRGWRVIELSGTYQRPTKGKRREEITVNTGTDGKITYLHTRDTCPGVKRRFFAEW